MRYMSETDIYDRYHYHLVHVSKESTLKELIHVIESDSNHYLFSWKIVHYIDNAKIKINVSIEIHISHRSVCENKKLNP